METVAPLPLGSAGSLNVDQYLSNPTVESAVAPSGAGSGVGSAQLSRPGTAAPVGGDVAARKPFPVAIAAAAGIAAVVVLLGVGLGVRQMTATSNPTLETTPVPATQVVVVPPVASPSPADPQLAAVQLRSNPNAGIFVDDESAGRTPAELRLKPGEHDLKLVAPSFEDWTRRVVVEPGVALTIPPADLVPLPASKVLNPTGKALGKDPILDSGGIMRVTSPTNSFRLGEDVQAIVYVSPLTNGIRDLAFDVVWKLERPGGQPPLELTARQEVEAAWQNTFMRVCVPTSAVDARGSNSPATLSLYVDDQQIDSFTFQVGPGSLNAPTQCNRDSPSQAPV
jgi:hypothetical protein